MSLWLIRDACWARATIEASPLSPWRPSFRRAAWHAVTLVAVVSCGMRTKHRERQRSSVRVKLKQLPRGWKTAGQVSMPHTASWLIEVANFAIANHCDLQWLHRTHHWPTSLHTLWLQTSLVNDFMMLFLLAWSCRKRQKATKRSENPWPSGKIWSGEQVSAEDVQRAPWLGCILESHTCRNYLVTMATRKEPPTFAVHSQNKSQFLGLPCQKDMMCLLKQCGTVTSH